MLFLSVCSYPFITCFPNITALIPSFDTTGMVVTVPADGVELGVEDGLGVLDGVWLGVLLGV